MNKDSTRPSSPAGAPKMDPRLAAALARGEIVRQQLAADEGGSISSAHAARLLGVSQATLLRRWRAHRVLAWRQGRAVRFPAWQFAGRKLVKGIEEVLQIFESDDQWRVMHYFLGPRHSLGTHRPLDLLREGAAAEVIAHAQAHTAENTW